MKNWKEVLISPATPLRDALGAIDRAGTQIALVVDAQGRLLGTLSDGDARRALLRGLELSARADAAMHGNPTTVLNSEDRSSILALMRRLGLRQIPVVDQAGVVVGLELVDDFLAVSSRSNWVVVMAGGLGKRLEELTRDVPKPMLKVGSRPLLETILRSFAAAGFRQFYLAVNYKADQIERHFGDGAALGVEIRYLREQKRMGTAGALSLLPEPPGEPFIVTNADLLTREDHALMLERHIASGAAATMAVREYEMQVPFGVVTERDGEIESIEEKPVQRFVVSAGMYVLSPELLKLVPADQFFDMPSLFDAAARNGLRTRTHQISGYWLDIGRMPDYERANLDFPNVFA